MVCATMDLLLDQVLDLMLDLVLDQSVKLNVWSVIMLELKPFKHIYYKNEQSDEMQDEDDNKSAFLTTLPSLRSNETTIWIF